MRILIVLANKKGSAVTDLIIGAGVAVFVILPLFSAVIDKYIILNKTQIIRDAVDMTNISIYNAIDTGNLGRNIVVFNSEETMKIYKALLAKNLNLNEDLSPKPESVADGDVRVDSIIIYTSHFPLICPNGTKITRPSIHANVTIPLKPSLYRQLMLDAIGREYFKISIHVDTDIPVNN